MPYQIKGSVGIICMREKMKIEESAVHCCVGLYPKRMIVSSYLGKRAKCRISILGDGGEIKTADTFFSSSTFHWRDGVVFFISVS